MMTLLSLEEQVARLRRALIDLVGVEEPDELEQMEAVLRLLPAAAGDQTRVLNAIRTLRDTTPTPRALTGAAAVSAADTETRPALPSRRELEEAVTYARQPHMWGDARTGVIGTLLVAAEALLAWKPARVDEVVAAANERGYRIASKRLPFLAGWNASHERDLRVMGLLDNPAALLRDDAPTEEGT